MPVRLMCAAAGRGLVRVRARLRSRADLAREERSEVLIRYLPVLSESISNPSTSWVVRSTVVCTT